MHIIRRQTVPGSLEEIAGRLLDGFMFGDYPNLPAYYDDMGDALQVSLDIPGVKKEDLRIEVKDLLLTIVGTRKGEELKKSIELPSTVDVERVEGDLQDGVLTIRLPKTRQASPRLIPIKG